MVDVITLIMAFVTLFGIMIVIAMLTMIIKTKKEIKHGDAQNNTNDHDDDHHSFI